MQDIRNQISQMAISINHLESQIQEKLPSQPKMNSKNVSAMTLRSGKDVEELELVTPKNKNVERIKKELEEKGIGSANPEVIPDSTIKVRSNSPPFPNKLEKLKKQDK